MKKLVIILFLFVTNMFTQEIDKIYGLKVGDSLANNLLYNDTIKSKILNTDRPIQIKLPRSYYYENKVEYPLIVVLDGDYLFDLVSGSVDYFSYWDEIPENIVVGISQKSSRFKDSGVYDNLDFIPISSTKSFYKFVSEELLEYITKNLRVSNFKIIVGHELTASISNFFLLENQPVFRGVISLSPRFSKNIDKYLFDALSKTNKKIVYTVSSSKNDFQSISNEVSSFSNIMNEIENENLIFNSLFFENENHYQLPTRAISESLLKTYSIYSDISRIEFDSIMKNIKISPIEYVRNKYEMIEEFYSIDKKVTINDLMAIEKYIEFSESYELYNELSKYSIEYYPETVLPSYYRGKYFELTENYRKAIQVYRSAYNMDEIGGYTKDYMLELADLLEDY